MTMTPASSQYFAQVAGQWDTIRAGYFSEAVREAAIRRAYLRPDSIVADVGGGTGFMAAGLAPLVRQVTVSDASPEMLVVARQNLKTHTNIIYRAADGGSLPLLDESLEAAFANMYLHHVSEPLEAIREMARTLKPGGRLVITDMDTHPFTWLKEEMADVWQGFEHSQVRAWFEQAGLVNVIVDCTGQSCSTQSSCACTPDEAREANISVFVAVGTKPVVGATESVGEHYAVIAEKGGSCDCGSSSRPTTASKSETKKQSCCGSEVSQTSEGTTPAASSCCCSDEAASKIADFTTGYSTEELQAVPGEAAEISLGCGNPTTFAVLQKGEVVLDIGSGGGIDAFLAAQQVGPQGRVIGVDMTPAMLSRARHAAQKTGLANVEFRLGQAEALPVAYASVDVILSNCVINLTLDKGRVFREAFRVLKIGGRLEVSDIVTDTSFPAERIDDAAAWGACVTGALPEQEYLDLIAQAGFSEARVRRSYKAGLMDGVNIYSVQVSAKK